MRRKRHVIRVPYTPGDLFAIQIEPDAWGYCRMRRGMGMEIPFICTARPGLPKIDWTSSSVPKFLCYFFGEVRDGDPLVVPVGNVPYATDADAKMPATYRDPDNSEPRYTIEENGIYRYTDDPRELKGILKHVGFIYATLGAFLKEQYRSGALTRVDVDVPKAGAATGAAKQPKPKAPLMVFAKIVQGIGPAQRERDYEEPLTAFLEENDLGEVTGGGTMQDKDGTVLFAGIDIEVRSLRRAVPRIARKLAELGAPEGSVLEYEADGEVVVYPIRNEHA